MILTNNILDLFVYPLFFGNLLTISSILFINVFNWLIIYGFNHLFIYGF